MLGAWRIAIISLEQKWKFVFAFRPLIWIFAMSCNRAATSWSSTVHKYIFWLAALKRICQAEPFLETPMKIEPLYCFPA